MKKILIVDDADNSTYSVFQATDEEFSKIFAKPNQDIVFFEDIRITKRLDAMFIELWKRPILKQNAVGIHGMIFYHSAHRRKHYPKSRRMIDMDEGAVNEYERELFAAERKRLDETED